MAIATLSTLPENFRKVRDFLAWLGLVPRQYSTGGKQRLGGYSEDWKAILEVDVIIGANSVIIKRHAHKDNVAG